jgi:hypothetical protein
MLIADILYPIFKQDTFAIGTLRRATWVWTHPDHICAMVVSCKARSECCAGVDETQMKPKKHSYIGIKKDNKFGGGKIRDDYCMENGPCAVRHDRTHLPIEISLFTIYLHIYLEQ